MAPEHRAPGGQVPGSEKGSVFSEVDPQSPELLHIQGCKCSNHV